MHRPDPADLTLHLGNMFVAAREARACGVEDAQMAAALRLFKQSNPPLFEWVLYTLARIERTHDL